LTPNPPAKYAQRVLAIRKRQLRLWAAFMCSGLILAVGASSAVASVTIGQVGDTIGTGCASGVEWVQPTVISGNTYVVPGAGTITSWTTFGGTGSPGQLTMKIFRAVAGQPGFYQVVGHDGPRTAVAGNNTFPADIAVKPGDLLGFHSETSNCYIFTALADTRLYFFGDLADGQSGGPFGSEGGSRLDIQAAFVPDNSFSVTSTMRNKNKGTATLSLSLPNPGDLIGSGNGANVASASGRAVISKSVPAGPAQLLIKAKGKKRKKLNETGKVKLNVAISYTPAGGDLSVQSLTLKLKKKL
jgi:hypothetical protein